MNQFVDTIEQKQQLEKVFNDYKSVKGSLMMVMQKAQDIYGYLPFEIQNRIAETLQIPLQEVYGIATFYTQFNILPKGKYKLGVCLGTACYIRGAGPLIEKLEEKLGIPPEGTTEDGKFTLTATRCIGCCGLAPVLTVNERVFGNLALSDIDKILEEYKDQ